MARVQHLLRNFPSISESLGLGSPSIMKTIEAHRSANFMRAVADDRNERRCWILDTFLEHTDFVYAVLAE